MSVVTHRENRPERRHLAIATIQEEYALIWRLRAISGGTTALRQTAVVHGEGPLWPGCARTGRRMGAESTGGHSTGKREEERRSLT